ncbi:sensor histidine kinase, partial [Stenotrophomonas maltophilia]|uniref:sensor histidine kinase n=1 Tax=Stenotrophomonas maltophilia TaxID=40324 RepID=UPI001EF88881
NALRYTDRGRVLLGCRRHGAFLRIEVWDTGRGIPADKHAEIFEEFRRLDEPHGGRSDKALGLGLAIVDRIANLLDLR